MKRCSLIEEVFIPLTAPELFETIENRPYSFLLDSGMDHSRLGRYSFLGSDPFLVMNSRGPEITVVRGHEREVQHGNPFDILGELLATYKLDRCRAPVPFTGGAVGYFGYDLRHFVERVPSAAVDDLELPESYFAFYDSVIAYDHLDERAYLIATGFPELEEEQRLKRARTRMAELKRWLDGIRPADVTSQGHKHSEGGRSSDTDRSSLGGNPDHPESREVALRSNFTREEYIRAVDKVRAYIAAGDAFQVNLSQRFDTALQVSPYELHKRLRAVNPSPFAGCLSFPGVTIVSASPERFLRKQGDRVETRPIKGTRPRGSDPAEDERLASELIESVKDRAENVMIVDLERNDLGRICRYGTVKVTELAILETFPSVFHLTSTIVGRLRQGVDNTALIKAVFPGGSITGAPKVRAMEIIDELEPTRRSVYSGSIGYLGFNDDLDINIAIRTFLIKEGRVYFQVGGGIIYDSDSAAEYTETLDKARGLVQALQLASGVVVAPERAR